MSYDNAEHASFQAAAPAPAGRKTAIPADEIAPQYVDAYVWLLKYWGYAPTLAQVADRLRVHPRTLKRWLAKYKLAWPPDTPASS